MANDDTRQGGGGVRNGEAGIKMRRVERKWKEEEEETVGMVCMWPGSLYFMQYLRWTFYDCQGFFLLFLSCFVIAFPIPIGRFVFRGYLLRDGIAMH